MLSDELIRMTAINRSLRRQLERCRRDIVMACATLCEELELKVGGDFKYSHPKDERDYTHPGDKYAEALRGMIGK